MRLFRSTNKALAAGLFAVLWLRGGEAVLAQNAFRSVSLPATTETVQPGRPSPPAVVIPTPAPVEGSIVFESSPGCEHGAGGADGGGDVFARVPEVAKVPLLGTAILPPPAPGYYSLLDVLRGNEREAPPKYPYPRFSMMTFSLFDADWRYLDDPNNQEHDWLDSLHRIRIGENILFSIGGEVRFRYLNEVDSRLTGIDNVYELLRTRVYGDLWITDRFRLYGELLDAHIYNNDLPPLVIDADHPDLLNLFADVRLFDFRDHGVYARIGRQEMLYGSQRLVSPLEWANTHRTFQGAKVYWHGDKLELEAFCVQPVIPSPGHFDSVDNQVIFSGFNATYRPRKGQEVDAYYYNLDNNNPVAVGFGGVVKGYNVSTVGGRYAGDVHNFLFDAEGMLQFGGFSNQGILAKAFTTGVGYNFKCVPLDPQVWLYYDFASGDPDPGGTNVHRTFNQLFPFGHYYFGYIDVVGRQNINDINGQLTIYPANWITAYMQYHIFRLDSPKDALYNAAGAPIRIDPTGKAGTDVGEELDFVVNFHLTNHQDVLLGYSHLFQGDFIRQTGPAGSPDFTYVQYSYRW
jgi:hypothetical protein